jgi:hypothetical protein
MGFGEDIGAILGPRRVGRSARTRAKRLPVPRVRHPLSESDQRAVVLGQAGHSHKSGDGDVSDSGQDLRREEGNVGSRPLPFPDGSLVRRILGAPEFGCTPSVPWVLVFSSQGPQAPARRSDGHAPSAALSAVDDSPRSSGASAGQLAAAVTADGRQRERACLCWRFGALASQVTRWLVRVSGVVSLPTRGDEAASLCITLSITGAICICQLARVSASSVASLVFSRQTPCWVSVKSLALRVRWVSTAST